MSDTLIKNMTLLSQNTLNGFGGIGEGVSMQVTQDGRRIIHKGILNDGHHYQTWE